MKYKRPDPLYEWKSNEPASELYLAQILDNKTVLSAYGRYGNGSASKSVSWQEFLNGEMNQLVEKTMGVKVLNELRIRLKELT